MTVSGAVRIFISWQHYNFIIKIICYIHIYTLKIFRVTKTKSFYKGNVVNLEKLELPWRQKPSFKGTNSAIYKQMYLLAKLDTIIYCRYCIIKTTKLKYMYHWRQWSWRNFLLLAFKRYYGVVQLTTKLGFLKREFVQLLAFNDAHLL